VVQGLGIGIDGQKFHAANLADTMRLIAAPPEPPTPTTLILANVFDVGLYFHRVSKGKRLE
jgi:hypothetical protein